MSYKLGSLFDGSGGFPLAGYLCGIEPVWAAEVEPYPIAVTRSRFPKMKHLGDISKINGAEIEPVDIITFGSPCQDLSVAGKRAGLKHEANGDEETTRSGLFMEAVRIIKEMRTATNGEYPRFALWENVPGAFSSNKGEDFRIVCEELIKIVEPSAFMPAVPKNGWSYSDSYIGDGWSLAYRVFDAQYWGVPQRRRRIHLVADFRGECARAVLFEREGVRGYFAQGGTPWQDAPTHAQDCTGADDREGESNGGRQLDAVNIIDSIGGQAERGWVGDKAPTLKATHYKSPPSVAMPICMATQQGGAEIRTDDKAPTITAAAGMSGNNQPVVCYKDQHLFENHSQDTRYKGPLDISPIVSATFGMGGNNQPFVVESAGFKPNQGAKAQGIGYEDEKSPTLLAGQEPGVVYCLQGNGIDRADTAGCNGKGWREDASYTLNTIDRPAVAYSINHQGGNVEQIIEDKTGTLTAAMNSSGNNKLSVCYRQGGFADYVEGEVGTLRASGGDLGGGTENLITYQDKVGALCLSDFKGAGNQYINDGKAIVEQFSPTNYIVRRLTPTECARLQGFADWWGHIEQKDSLTAEEYRFWLEVRNTHAAINGKKVQDYTERQMLAWYNKLWTDSAEYKMWGNGIALPPALYCLQGITDALSVEEVDEWML